MKRYLAAVIAAVMLFASCDGGKTPAQTTDTDDTTTAATTSSTTAPAPEAHWNDDGWLKILTIGNSFSDDTMEYVYDIAASAGVENIVLGNLVIGGCSLDTHYKNATEDTAAYTFRHNYMGTWYSKSGVTISEAVGGDDWDFVSIQQVSNDSGRRTTYRYIGEMVAYLRELIPESAKIVWNMTWAYQQDSTHPGFSYYYNDQMQMYSDIVSAVEKKVLTEEGIDIVAPTGTAVQNARSSYLGDTLTRDGYHLSLDIGRYIAGMAFVRTLTGLPMDGVTFVPYGVHDSVRLIAIEAAENAAKAPFEPASSQYTEQPDYGIEELELISFELTNFAYWVSTDPALHHTLVTTADNSPSFFATEMMTREDIPVGSVIVIESGWQYRPEGWKDDNAQSVRPSATSARYVEVTEEWWGEYTHRAFNISKMSGESLVGIEDEAAYALKIYVPKK